jgi:hypothetical protein
LIKIRGMNILNNSKIIIENGENTVMNLYTEGNSKLDIVAKFPVPKNPKLKKNI